MQDDEIPVNPDPAPPQKTPAATGSAPNRQPVSPVILAIAFIVIVLLGVIIFQNLIPRNDTAREAESPALKSLQADIETRRSELNRERIALGLDPLPGAGGVESPDEIADRLKKDAETLASLASSFQDLLSRKESQLAQVREESLAALKEQKRLRDLLDQTASDLREAMIDASLASTIKSDLDKARANIATLNEEIIRLREEPGEIRAQLIESNRRRNELEARVAELEEQLRRASLFASSETELIQEAVALFRALRRLEGSTEAELAAAYSRFGAELRAEVLHIGTFATGSAEVGPDLESKLRSIPAEAPENALVLVVGYASETGNVDANQTLSSDRATAVARLLDSIKRPTQRVQAVYLGQTDRFSTRIPKENQRVEIWQILPRSAGANGAGANGAGANGAGAPAADPPPEPMPPADGDGDGPPPLREVPDFR